MKKQAKTEILSCRVTPGQREIIEEKAFSSYRTPSMYLRDCALDKKIIVVNGIDELTSELSFAYEVDLRETREEVARIWQSLNSLLQEVR